MSNNSGGLLKPFVIGLVVGVVGAALLTPCRGKELRAEIKTNSREGFFLDFQQSLQEKFIAFLHITKEQIDRLIKRFDDFTNQGVGVLLEDEIL